MRQFRNGFWIVALCLVPHSLSAIPAGTPAGAAEETWDYVKVLGVASDQSSLDIAVAPFNDCSRSPEGAGSKCEQLHLLVKDSVVKDRLKQLHIGDRIRIIFAPGVNVLTEFCIDQAPEVSVGARIFVLVSTAAFCFLIAVGWTRANPLKLTIGMDGHYSNSKFQIAVWFFVLLVTYLAALWLRIWFLGCDFIAGISIPQNLLLVSGMSVITYGGAKAITTAKVAEEQAKPNGNPDPKNSAGTNPSFFRDLTHDDGIAAHDGHPAVPPHLDFGDFQMLMITLVAVGTYVVLVFSFLGTLQTLKNVALPDLDTTILASFGLGHGAYLTKKAAGNVGQS